jgi:iron complex transport system permease protein
LAIEIATVSAEPVPSMPQKTAKTASARGGGYDKDSERRGARLSPLVLIVFLTATLAVAALVSLATGAVAISPRTIFAAMLGQQPLTEMQRLILFHIRLPRVLASGLVGAALAMAGLLFQGLFRNPIADPYVIGSSGGAIFGACIGIFFFSQWSVFGFSATALLAFAGSAATMALVYSLARSAGKTNVVTLLLAGFAISTMFTNTSYFFELFDKSGASNRILLSWLHGVIGIPAWTELGVSAALLCLSVVASLPLMRTLNTLALGDEYAQQLGVRVEFARVWIILIGSLLTAVAVSLGGMISFAGLIVPHVGRLLLGPDHVRLLPVTALGGAIFLMLADTAARTVFAPSEVPVGIIMAFIGAPFFLYLLRKMKRSYTV